MEANEASDFPEKVYIPRDPECPQFPDIWWERESDGSNIEYVRTDAFMKKVFDAYCKVCGHYEHSVPNRICRLSCSYFKDFKKYMEG